MDWQHVVSKVADHIVHISTPYGDGTGFLCIYNDDKTIAGIATAAHVVGESDRWKQPIELFHPSSGTSTFLEAGGRATYIDWATDSAVLLIPNNLKLPQDRIQLFPTNKNIDIGVEVGWLGFPAIAPVFTSCFFSGNVSARLPNRNAYLIDGVAINGVSGGPVMYATPTDGIHIVGIVSAYNANRTTGEALPGLLVAQDVSHFHGVAQRIKSIDDAKKQQQQTPKPPPSVLSSILNPTPNLTGHK